MAREAFLVPALRDSGEEGTALVLSSPAAHALGARSFRLRAPELPDAGAHASTIDPTEHRRVLVGLDGGSVRDLDSP